LRACSFDPRPRRPQPNKRDDDALDLAVHFSSSFVDLVLHLHDPLHRHEAGHDPKRFDNQQKNDQHLLWADTSKLAEGSIEVN
jgi:hypothetical protein